MALLERIFKLSENGSSVSNEVRGGTTTFLTMAYIIFVQPAVLSIAGMPQESVFLATCLSASLATIIMGLLANYPIALAPGMGENFFFVFSVALLKIGDETVGWQAALTVVFISGILFFLMTVFRIREMIMDAVPRNLRRAIAVGIGLFIAEIGLLHSGVIAIKPSSMLPGLGNLSSPPTLVAIAGFLVAAVLVVKKIRGGILIGILFTTILGLLAGVVEYKGIVSMPPNDFSVFFAFDFAKVFSNPEFITLIIIFLFMDTFDTLGTLVGVTEQAGLTDKNGNLPRANRAFLADATGTVAGSCMGTSTVTSFIESSSGVEDGARTGLANMVTGLLFLLALFFSPLVSMIGAGWMIPESSPPSFLYPITAPALIIVGVMMIRNVKDIDWDDIGESIPAFLTIIGIPLSFSISDGLAFGFITYPFIKLFDGKIKSVNPLMFILGLLFVARYVFL